MFNKIKIPVHSPDINGDDIKSVVRALKQKEISGTSKLVEKFEKKFADFLGVKHAVAVSNGTSALFLAAKVAGIKTGDQVLVSTTTNIATALAVYHNGGTTIPVDSDKITWNLNLDLIEKLITKKTKAIIPVHFLGLPIDMDRLSYIAKKNNLIVIEDCAESHGATWKNKLTGTFGDMACYSFYANKIVTSGEGGMVVTNKKSYADKIKFLRNLAPSVPRFFHREAGYNFRMGSLQAALGISQLKRIKKSINQKTKIASIYNNLLGKISGIQIPSQTSHSKNVYWMYGIVIDKKKFGISRDGLARYLKKNGIQTRTFFCPLNMQPFLKKQHRLTNKLCPVGKNLWNSGLYLPSSNLIKKREIDKICTLIKNMQKK